MVVLNRIYTRTGDDGTTALGNGERLAKYAPRIEAYGTVDETNAAIGLARSYLDVTAYAELDRWLLAIQNDLFDLGADLCVPERPPPALDRGGGETGLATSDGEAASRPARARLSISAAQVARLEQQLDQMNEALSPLRSFVLPGGSQAAAALHIARTVCRRAERLIVMLASDPPETVGAEALKYINRLSDFLFVASRFANDRGARDVLWVPGQNL